jgi:CBS-domain-containing membrane protein
MSANVLLALFNLLPAFPMDGGRALRALLATRMEYTRATQQAATIGQGMAFLFGLIGLMGNPVLVFVGLFVWIGAAQEASLAQVTVALTGIPVRRAMITDFRVLRPDDTIAEAANLSLASAQTDFPVVQDGRIVGLVIQGDVRRGLTHLGARAAVGEIMQRDFQTADAYEMLELAFRRLQTCRCRTMPVTDEGRLVGLLTTDSMGEFLALQAGRPAAATSVPPRSA